MLVMIDKFWDSCFLSFCGLWKNLGLCRNIYPNLSYSNRLLFVQLCTKEEIHSLILIIEIYTSSQCLLGNINKFRQLINHSKQEESWIYNCVIKIKNFYTHAYDWNEQNTLIIDDNEILIDSDWLVKWALSLLQIKLLKKYNAYNNWYTILVSQSRYYAFFRH